MTLRALRRGPTFVLCAVCLSLAGSASSTVADGPLTVLIGLGDSLTHGTMDATNNQINTSNAFLQQVKIGLAQRLPLFFRQPFFDANENRIDPSRTPTNLAVDGADTFTLDGLDYYKRAGTAESQPSASLIADKLLPSQFSDKYDKVLYPINVFAGQPITQMGAAEWLLSHALPAAGLDRAITVYWVGNNDSSTAALGFGGSNPMFLPLPLDQLAPVLPGIIALLQFAEARGLVSVEPYSAASIDRNLTNLQDFTAKQGELIARLVTAGSTGNVQNHVFILTLPYYSAIGYLLDSEDIEFYLRKVNPRYRVPPSFARVAPLGQPITDPLKGDRISFLTFGLMYTLLDTGFPVSYVNQVLDVDGQQRDGLVLSEAEARVIMSRIDGFNAALRALAQAAGPNVHLVDVGPLLSDVLTGRIPVTIGGRKISRKWIRGSSFGFDGVHPNYTGQALIGNIVLSRINAALGLDAPLASLPGVMANDPYIDRDGDGWAPGPVYQHPGVTALLFLFKDPNDGNALLGSVTALRPEARRLGLSPN